MSNTEKLNKSDLMKQILEIRYTDIEEEIRLCKQLLDIGESDDDSYACAFANVYLLDSYLALGEYQNCSFYTINASLLCAKHGYDDLRLILCNCAGLYYLKLNDEQSALEYFLHGLKLAKAAGNYNVESMLLNNIGFSFGYREDWESAKSYFSQAYQAIEPHIQEVTHTNFISYLSNIAESCLALGDIAGCEMALEKCEALNIKTLYHKIKLACSKCAKYAIENEHEKCIAMSDSIIALGLFELESKFFVCDMCTDLCRYMLQFDEKKRAEAYIEILDKFGSETSLVTRYQIQILKINYFEKYNLSDKLEQAYKIYYDIVNEMDKMDDNARAQSMLSKVQLKSVLMERDAITSKNRELESEGQLDGLTGLYNRRHFNKVISKIVADSQSLTSIGVIMLDIDYLKQYNDHYGHFKGDAAIKTVADALNQNASEHIFVSRYGGDEFLCLCINLSDREVTDLVERIIAQVSKHNIEHVRSPISDRLSVSIGYCNEENLFDIDKLLSLADDALYQAKKSGRNQAAMQKLL